MYRKYFIIVHRPHMLTVYLDGKPILRKSNRYKYEVECLVHAWHDAINMLGWHRARQNYKLKAQPMALMVIPPRREPEQDVIADVATRLQDVISAVSALMQVTQLVMQGAQNA